MTQMIDIKVTNQYSHILEAKALLRNFDQAQNIQNNELLRNIEHIVVDGEIILPSIELLFESQHSENIYRLVE